MTLRDIINKEFEVIAEETRKEKKVVKIFYKLNLNLIKPTQAPEQPKQQDNELNNQYKKLNVGESLTIPILFEYYLTDSFTNSSITKTLAFDLRPSLTRQLDNYIFRIIISRNLTDDNNSEYVPKIINDTINEQ